MEFDIIQWAVNQGVAVALAAFILVRLDSKLASICISNAQILEILRKSP